MSVAVSWSCDPDAANKLSFPLSKELHIKLGVDWPSRLRDDNVRELWTTTTTTDGRRSMGIL